MDADTRARLADALATATPAQLREDAAFIANAQTLLGNNDERFLRLAALALACADLEENGRSVAFFGKPVRWGRVEIDGDDVDCAAQGPTLPAALAALLTEDA